MGSVTAFLYNSIVSYIPSRSIRHGFMRLWAEGFGDTCSIQMRCQFLNARKISIGDRSVINFGCLLDGRQFKIKIGSDVSIGPEASILSMSHDMQSESFEATGTSR